MEEQKKEQRKTIKVELEVMVTAEVLTILFVQHWRVELATGLAWIIQQRSSRMHQKKKRSVKQLPDF